MSQCLELREETTSHSDDWDNANEVISGKEAGATVRPPICNQVLLVSRRWNRRWQCQVLSHCETMCKSSEVRIGIIFSSDVTGTRTDAQLLTDVGIQVPLTSIVTIYHLQTLPAVPFPRQ